MTRAHLGGEHATTSQRTAFKVLLRERLPATSDVALLTVADAPSKPWVEAITRRNTPEAESWLEKAKEIAPCLWAKVAGRDR